MPRLAQLAACAGLVVHRLVEMPDRLLVMPQFRQCQAHGVLRDGGTGMQLQPLAQQGNRGLRLAALLQEGGERLAQAQILRCQAQAGRYCAAIWVAGEARQQGGEVAARMGIVRPLPCDPVENRRGTLGLAARRNRKAEQ